MTPAAVLLAALLLAPLATLHAAETPVQSCDALVTQRLREGLSSLEAKHWPPSRVATSLFLLFKNEKADEASGLIQAHIAAQTNSAGKIVAENRCEGLFRVYLLERTGPLLSPQARAAIEDYAWSLLETFPGAMRKDADKPFWNFDSSENHYVNFRRRVFLALSVVRKSERYGPRALLEGEPVESHYQAWVKGAQLPKINGTTVNLNPAKTYDSPFLSMDHGSNKAVIQYPAHDALVLEF